MKKKLIIISVMIFILFIILCTVVIATNIDDLGDQREELQSQIDETEEQIKNIQVNLTKALEELNELNNKISDYETNIREVETNLTDIYNAIIEVEEQLKHIEADFETQKSSLEKRLVAMYEAGETNYLDVLLKSKSLSDFISNYYLISEMAAYDNDLLDTIEREKTLIADIKANLEEKRTNLKTLKDTRERTLTALENTKIIKNEYAKKLSDEEKETQKKIDEFRAELDRIDREILAMSLQNMGEGYVGGEFAWPTPGYTTITSMFGMRFHPIFKINRMHSGVDIGAPTGVNIIAVNDGVVVKAEYTVGYGNMVMINHGGGVSTVYGHGSKIIAKVGQEVKRGDVIMEVGSTGWSTGPHLHFEVRINGTCVEPLPYITTTNKKTIDTNKNESEEQTNEIE